MAHFRIPEFSASPSVLRISRLSLLRLTAADGCLHAYTALARGETIWVTAVVVVPSPPYYSAGNSAQVVKEICHAVECSGRGLPHVSRWMKYDGLLDRKPTPTD